MLGSVKILDDEEEAPLGRKDGSTSHSDKRNNDVTISRAHDSTQEARLPGEGQDGKPKVPSGVQQRDDWMEHPPHAAWEQSYSRRERGEQEKQPKLEVSTRNIDSSSTMPATNRPTEPKSFSVGDGGASWRMKALKRAQVQAQVEGTSLNDVVQQRWGSVSELAVSAERAAPSDAHHRSKRDRKIDKVSSIKGKMKRPRSDGARRGVERSGARKEYADLVDHAARHINAFKDDGSFVDQFKNPKRGERKEEPVEVEDNIVHRQQEELSTGREQGAKDNNSVAAMLRARLSGKGVEKSPSTRGEEEREVVLPLVDAMGKAAPGAFGRETAAQAHGSRDHHSRLERYQDGKKSRYFADDDIVDLDTMVRRSKHGDEEQMDAVIARNIAKRSHFKGNEFNVDDEYEFDAGVEFLESSKVSKKGRQRGHEKEELARKEKAKQVREYKSMSRALDKCRLCLNSEARKKHLMVSVGTCAYLALPERGRLVPGHCCVVPTEHIPSARVADENTWEEMRNFKKCVLQMFADQGKDCIFIETVLDVDPLTRSHALVECIPVSHSVASKAPMYFKKAIDDATNDWSQHASKRCIETESRNLQRKIPPNFPYVHIEFGLASGFVHVIDDIKEFDRLFARRVLIGLMGLPEEHMHGRISTEGEGVQRQWVHEFQKVYTTYDWVPQLHHS